MPPYIKITLKWIMDLNVKPNTIKIKTKRNKNTRECGLGKISYTPKI